MKTILVLTDFSLNADFAAHYALKFAQKIKANLLLCNIYTVPYDDINPAPRAWPLVRQEEESIEDLGALLAGLKTAIDTGDPNDYRPEINQYSQEGSVIDCINDIATKNNILMAIISTHDASFLTTLNTGNHTRDVIEKANFPVLVIPYQVRYKDYKTIAFASDMADTDLDVLKSLSSLAEYSDSGIMITNVDNSHATEQEEENTIKKFFDKEVYKNVHPKILYKAIKSKNVSSSLRWLSQHIEIDLMVLVRRKQTFFQKLLDGSIIEKMADHPAKPLLIVPYHRTNQPVPVF
jgi:nucleotide-binding universal stress UspA family protein